MKSFPHLPGLNPCSASVPIIWYILFCAGARLCCSQDKQFQYLVLLSWVYLLEWILAIIAFSLLKRQNVNQLMKDYSANILLHGIYYHNCKRYPKVIYGQFVIFLFVQQNSKMGATRVRTAICQMLRTLLNIKLSSK